MLSIYTLIEEHEALRDKVHALRVVSARGADEPERVHHMLATLQVALDEHMDSDAEVLFVEDGQSAQSRLEQEIMAADAEFTDLKREWLNYRERWSVAAIAEQPARFAQETIELMKRVELRIDLENKVLYPLALQASRLQLRPKPN